MKHNLLQLRIQCPLPVLMNRLGYGRFARSSCPSPFRSDQNASWGVYQAQKNWMFKDLATGECGDEIHFLAHVHKLDAKRDFIQLLRIYAEAANRPALGVPLEVLPSTRTIEKPDTSFLNEGTEEQLKILSELRNISLEGLRFAQLRKVLMFGQWKEHELYAVTDKSGLLAEIRRLDGLEFLGYGRFPGHKSHTLPHSRKNWPLGIMEAATSTGIALVEGMPDFLALHQFVVEEGLSDRVAPVAMLTSSCDIAHEALPYFTGKNVRIFPHHDQSGITAAERWRNQLIVARANRVDFIDFHAFETGAGNPIKDLCDFNRLRGAAGYQQQQLLDNLAI